jgi:hypothetical protein
MEEHHHPCIASQPFAVPAAQARVLQVALKLVVDLRAKCGVPLHCNIDACKRGIVRVRKVVAFARQSEVERPASAADQRGRATIGRRDQPAVRTLRARSFKAKPRKGNLEDETVYHRTVGRLRTGQRRIERR